MSREEMLASGGRTASRPDGEARRAREQEVIRLLAASRRQNPLRLLLQSNVVLFILSIVFVLLSWQAIVVLFGVPGYILPKPLAVGEGVLDNTASLWRNSLVTLKSVSAGFAIAIVAGTPVAFAISFSRPLNRLIYPLLVAGQAVPKVAIAPILVAWFGFGFRSNVAVAASIAIFPIVINFALGLQMIDPEFVRLGRSMGASRFLLFWKIRLPHALPAMFVGLKLGITFAVIGAVVGEFIAGGAGLGYLIQLSTGQLRTVLAFSSIVVLSVLSIALFYLIDGIERLVVSWHPAKEVLTA